MGGQGKLIKPKAQAGLEPEIFCLIVKHTVSVTTKLGSLTIFPVKKTKKI